MVLLGKNDHIWLNPKTSDEFAVPVGARVLDVRGNSATVVDDDGVKSTITIDDRIQVMHKSVAEGRADMIDLGELTEGSILRNLFTRYKDGKIYTYIGSILTAVNPYRNMPIYGNDAIAKYKEKQLEDNEPHIYAIADNAYRDMKSFSRDETIIISGESGSGKTESTKVFLKYLAYSSGQHSWIEQQILDSNPILEAFGNAKTVRNDNSSRFGKYIDIIFDKDGHILTAEILQYLLEKSRIVSQDTNERNYHIFYSMLAGLSPQQKSQFGLTDGTSYNYLRQDSMKVTERDELTEWNAVLAALKVMQISEESVTNICRLLASVLLIGQIDYSGGKQRSTDSVKLQDSRIVDQAASVMMIDGTAFKNALTHKSIMVSNNIVTKDINREQAIDIRDAFVKSVYGKMFEWIVAEINRAIKKQVAAKDIRRFGILDIFGFESVGTNSFEQLCINYTNERLQQFFVHHVFKIEQNEYDRENINWEKIRFVDNKNVIDFIALQKLSVFALIDEESIFPKGTDKSFMDKLFNVHGNSKHLVKVSNSDPNQLQFMLKHFAGDILYSAKNFLEKNRDTHSLDFQRVIIKAANPFLKEIFGDMSNEQTTLSIRKTLGNQFKQSMEHLMETMGMRHPYFIRCIKPNENKSDNEFNRSLITKQLRYSGMLETITIRRAGYPIRHLFRDFVPRYYLVLKLAVPYAQGMNDAELARQICNKSLKQSDYQIGKTKVFLKDQGNADVEKARHDVLSESIIGIQSIIRNWANARIFERIRKSTVCVQSYYRNSEQQRSYAKMRRGFMRLQSIYHSELISKRYDSLMQNLPQLQQQCRNYLLRSINQRMALTVMAFQEEVRRYLASRQIQTIIMKEEEIRDAEKKRKDQERKLTRTVGPVRAKAEADRKFEITISEITRNYEILEDYEKSQAENKMKKIDELNMRRHEVLSEQQLVDRAFRGVFDDEGPDKTEEEVELDLAEFKFQVYAKRNFANGATPSHISTALNSSLLKQQNKLYEMAAASSFIVLLKYMGDIKLKKQKSKMKNMTVAEFLLANVSSRLLIDDQTELDQLAESFRGVEINEKNLIKHSFLPKVELTPFESIQYIVGLGVFIRDLRDEIYCQIMKQLTANDSVENFAKGWILLLITAAFFAPSEELLKYLKSFLKSGPKAYGRLGLHRLARVVKNGQRSGAPTHFECQALKARTPMEISVTLMDDSVTSIYIDSTTTGKEAVGSVAAKLKIRDIYGFGVRATVFGTSQIIYDTDHVLDAVEVCENYTLKVGIPLSSMPIKFFLMKVFFAPWSIPYDDSTAVRLIYQQFLRGLRYGEYPCGSDEEHAYFAVQAYYADVGPKLTVGDFDSFLPKVTDELDFQSKRSRQEYSSIFQRTFSELVPDLKAEFHDNEEGRERVRALIVDEMKYRWPIKFARIISDVDISGPTTSYEGTDLVMTWKALSLSIDNRIVHSFLYPEIVEVSPVRPHDHKRSKESFTVVTPLANFVMSSARAKMLRNTIRDFMENLRQRSRYAVATKDYKPEGRGSGNLALRRGDLVNLYVDDGGKRILRDGFMEGENDRNGHEGQFPADSVYVIPTGDKPNAEVMLSIVQLPFKEISKYLLRDETSKDVFPEWRSFAMRNIGPSAAASKEWDRSSERLIMYQKSPLKTPLLTEIMADKEVGPPLKTLGASALNCFIAILAYGQLPRKGFKKGYCQRIIDDVFAPCLAVSANKDDSNLLRDEIYCQILKQLMGPPADVFERMWELMWLATGLFVPRRELLDVIIHYLRTRDNKVADSCVNRLFMIKEKGQRKLPPTLLEIDTAQKRAYRLFHLVALPDNSQERIEVDCVCKIQDLEKRLGSRLGIKIPDEFKMVLKTKSGVHSIPEGTYFFDFLRELGDKFITSKGFKDAVDLRFVYELIYVRYLWINVVPGENPRLDIAFHYPQESQKYLQGHYTVTPDDAVEIAALIYRAKFGQDTTRFAYLSREFREYIPKEVVVQLDSEAWVTRIEDAYLEKENVSADGAKVDLVRMLNKYPQFGTSIYPVKQTTNRRFPADIIISVSKRGVGIADAASKKELAHGRYNRQMEFRVTKGQFHITLDPSTRILCETSNEQRIADQILAYRKLLDNDENESENEPPSAIARINMRVDDNDQTQLPPESRYSTLDPGVQPLRDFSPKSDEYSILSNQSNDPSKEMSVAKSTEAPSFRSALGQELTSGFSISSGLPRNEVTSDQITRPNRISDDRNTSDRPNQGLSELERYRQLVNASRQPTRPPQPPPPPSDSRTEDF